ncbi:hypothetical protein GE300_06470 [Rhodobacteraceae bacterium 2CG4]|uniref:Uncharacterized protein n=1 Tax=Halovulum marinum TaxID=2662447 RepID=A0A6L5YY51_9RHOB|nr:hypothetical protein [Halovulum marinum]MSU89263.1 hypothetical protein [Halovulum marinum]
MKGLELQISATTVFCDDIRREDTGKAILIGVYVEDMIPSTLPSRFSLSIWTKFFGISSGNHPFKVEIDFPGGHKFEWPGEVDISDPNVPTSLFAAGIPAVVKEAGLIKAQLYISGKNIDAGELLVREPQPPAKE